MATSQFTIYTSFDVGGPGPIYGNSGSLISVLNACLVNGYTGHPSAGWTKPVADFSNYATYQPISGARATLFVNDNYVANGKEADVTGWITMTSITSSATQTSASNVGAGYGQFPAPSQSLSIGKLVWRKSATSDVTTPRYWFVAADAYTMYIWINAGDAAGTYAHGGFGDFYSLYGAGDLGRCLIYGRTIENSPNGANTANTDFTDTISLGCWSGQSNTLFVPMPGHYLARTIGGTTQSTPFTIKGDLPLSNGNFVGVSVPYGCPMNGSLLSSPNPIDNNFYMSPLWIVDPGNASFRGKWRGMHQLCHGISNFSDGQVISGTGTFAGKTFMIIKTGYNGGMWALETSNTLLTN